MTTAADLIADLDAHLSDVGSAATLRRYTSSTGSPRPHIDVAVTAAIRPVSSSELVGDIIQSDEAAVISPTPVNAAAWPLPARKNDKLIVDGKEFIVVEPRHARVLGTIVRIELIVRG